MPSRLLLAATVVALVLGSLGGCAALGGADDAPTAASGTGETTPFTAPSVNATSPTGEPGSTTSGSPSGEPARRAIRTTKKLYFGRPFETIQIPGTYEGMDRATRLRLQVLDHGHWRTYPLPVLTSDSGSFSAFVELAVGRYQVRLVDPATGRSTAAVTVLVF